MVGAASPLHPVFGDPVLGADRDVEDLQLGVRVFGDLRERLDPPQLHVLRIGHGAEHAPRSRKIFPQAADALAPLLDQRTELPWPRRQEHFPIRHDRHVEVDQRGAPETVPADHVDGLEPFDLDEAQRIRRRSDFGHRGCVALRKGAGGVLGATLQHRDGQFAARGRVRDPQPGGGDSAAVTGTEDQDVVLGAQRIRGCRQNRGCFCHHSNLRLRDARSDEPVNAYGA